MVIRYPLDETGTSPDNLVLNEPHELGSRQVRCIALHYGAFFTESLRVRDAATGQPLNSTQYYPAELYAVPTALYGKEICAIIVITDPTVSGNVLVDYQVLGGYYGASTQAIIQQLENLNLDDRPVSWPNIIDKPSEFPPTWHYHDAGDIFGFEFVVQALDRIRDAILMGDKASHDEIYRYIDRMYDELVDLIDRQGDALRAHIADKNNPHQTTPGKIGAYTTQQVDSLIASLRSELNTVVITVGAGTTLSSRSAYNRRYIGVSGSGAIVVPGGVFQKDDVVYLRADSGSITVVGSGCSINLPYGQNNVLAGSGSTVALVFRSGTVADLIGQTQFT